VHPKERTGDLVGNVLGFGPGDPDAMKVTLCFLPRPSRHQIKGVSIQRVQTMDYPDASHLKRDLTLSCLLTGQLINCDGSGVSFPIISDAGHVNSVSFMRNEPQKGCSVEEAVKHRLYLTTATGVSVFP